MDAHHLTSSSNPHLKHLERLVNSSDYRAQQKRIVVAGIAVIQELAAKEKIYSLLATDPSLFTLPADKKYTTTLSRLKQITGLHAPPPLIAEFSMPEPSDLKHCKRIVVFDGLQNPGNVGAIIRSALAFGMDSLFYLPGCVNCFHPACISSAKGATFHLPYAYGDISDLVAITEGKTLYRADLTGQPACPLDEPFALCFGNEGHGCREEIVRKSAPISIPMSASTESLNVSVAAGILFYATRKKL